LVLGVRFAASCPDLSGRRCEAADTGGPLILEYQKSRTTHTDYLAISLDRLAV
jgi:hypothetical protein